MNLRSSKKYEVTIIYINVLLKDYKCIVKF